MAQFNILINIISCLMGIASVVISCISLYKIGTIDNKIREVKLQDFEKLKLPQWMSEINRCIDNPTTESVVALKKALYSIKEIKFFKDRHIVKITNKIIEELQKEPQDIQSLSSELMELRAKLEQENHLKS